MSTVLKRENITITIGEYQKDGATKKVYKTIGELVTMQGDDGSTYQFGEMWGPTGSTKFNVYEQTDRTATAPQQAAQAPQQMQQQPQQQPQQNYQQDQQQLHQQRTQDYNQQR